MEVPCIVSTTPIEMGRQTIPKQSCDFAVRQENMGRTQFAVGPTGCCKSSSATLLGLPPNPIQRVRISSSMRATSLNPVMKIHAAMRLEFLHQVEPSYEPTRKGVSQKLQLVDFATPTTLRSMKMVNSLPSTPTWNGISEPPGIDLLELIT